MVLTGSVVVGEKYEVSLEGSGEETVRRDAVEAEREMVWLREKKRRVDPDRFTGAGLGTAGERGGDMGPRRSFRRLRAALQRVQGWWWDSAIWPQPLLDSLVKSIRGVKLCCILRTCQHKFTTLRSKPHVPVA